MTGKKKVLLCSPYNTFIGGISTWASHIVEYYNSADIDNLQLDVFPLNRNKPVYTMFAIPKRVTLGLKDYIPLIWKFGKIIKSKKYDLIHLVSSASFGLIKDIVMLKMASKNKVKTVIHFRFGRIPELYKNNNWEKILLDLTIRLADCAIVIDKASYDSLIKQGYGHIRLLPNPLGLTVNKIISCSPIKREKNIIVFVGQVLPAKGIFELVEASREIPYIKLKIIGPVTDKVKKEIILIAGANNGWVEITGEKDYESTIKEMLSAGVFVLPSHTEGFPNVILESMACGCPIVASAVGAIPEMLDINGDTPAGICIEPQNTEQLKIALLKMINDKKLASTYGENAKWRVNQIYSMPVVWEQLVRIWECLIG